MQAARCPAGAPYNPDPAPYTPKTAYPTPLRPTPNTQHPEPQALHPKPQTVNPPPETRVAWCREHERQRGGERERVLYWLHELHAWRS